MSLQHKNPNDPFSPMIDAPSYEDQGMALEAKDRAIALGRLKANGMADGDTSGLTSSQLTQMLHGDDKPNTPPGGNGVQQQPYADPNTESSDEASYAKGGLIKGPGTGTSDSIQEKIPVGGAIIPADVVKLYGQDYFNKLEAAVPDAGGGKEKVTAKISNGEFQLSPEAVAFWGKDVINKLIGSDNESAEQSGQPDEVEAPKLGVQGYAKGGVVNPAWGTSTPVPPVPGGYNPHPASAAAPVAAPAPPTLGQRLFGTGAGPSPLETLNNALSGKQQVPGYAHGVDEVGGPRDINYQKLINDTTGVTPNAELGLGRASVPNPTLPAPAGTNLVPAAPRVSSINTNADFVPDNNYAPKNPGTNMGPTNQQLALTDSAISRAPNSAETVGPAKPNPYLDNFKSEAAARVEAARNGTSTVDVGSTETIPTNNNFLSSKIANTLEKTGAGLASVAKGAVVNEAVGAGRNALYNAMPKSTMGNVLNAGASYLSGDSDAAKKQLFGQQVNTLPPLSQGVVDTAKNLANRSERLQTTMDGAKSLGDYGHVVNVNQDNIPVSPVVSDLSNAKIARSDPPALSQQGGLSATGQNAPQLATGKNAGLEPAGMSADGQTLTRPRTEADVAANLANREYQNKWIAANAANADTQYAQQNQGPAATAPQLNILGEKVQTLGEDGGYQQHFKGGGSATIIPWKATNDDALQRTLTKEQYLAAHVPNLATTQNNESDNATSRANNEATVGQNRDQANQVNSLGRETLKQQAKLEGAKITAERDSKHDKNALNADIGSAWDRYDKTPSKDEASNPDFMSNYNKTRALLKKYLLVHDRDNFLKREQ